MTFRDTKNGETRSVSLSDAVLDCLSKEKAKRIIQSEYVFPSFDGSKPADFTTSWKKVVRSIGLNICFHTLRHTGALHLAMNGATLLEIAAILGHKTLAMVKRYSHLTTSSTAKVLDKMNRNILRSAFMAKRGQISTTEHSDTIIDNCLAYEAFLEKARKLIPGIGYRSFCLRISERKNNFSFSLSSIY